jgi:hypothetical protein
MRVATFLSLDAEQGTLLRRGSQKAKGQAGLANNAWLLPCFHSFALRIALVPYWPLA